MGAKMQWTGVREVMDNMRAYAQKVEDAVKAVMDYWQPVIENFAKQEADWIDRTGNARAGPHAFVETVTRKLVSLYLAHQMSYGVWLELKGEHPEIAGAGKYAIILPTLEQHQDAIMTMLKDIFK